MDEEKPINDNRFLEYGMLDPDRHYVSDYLKKACEHFRECKIHPATIIDALTTEIVGLLPGNPFRDPVDEHALLSDLMLLGRVRHRIEPLIEQYEKGIRRGERQRKKRRR